MVREWLWLAGLVWGGGALIVALMEAPEWLDRWRKREGRRQRSVAVPRHRA